MKTLLPLAAILALVTFAPTAAGHTLRYSTAKRAAKERLYIEANGNPNRLVSIVRTSQHRYFAQGTWEYDVVKRCEGCRYNEATDELVDTFVSRTVTCSVDMVVKFRSSRSRRVRTVMDSKSCY